MGGLLFVSVALVTLRVSEMKVWRRPSVLLASGVLVLGIASTLSPTPVLLGIKWGLLTVFFALTCAALFSFIKNAQDITRSHLSTAVSIYLLIGLMYFSLFSTIEVVRPGCFRDTSSAVVDRQSDLLYFSLITLSTVGYGDIVPVYGVVRMLAAVEGITGVLYVAIMVALLVSTYRRDTAR